MAKVSPFVLNDRVLTHLVEVSGDEPSVADLVANYRRSVEDLTEIGSMIHEELAHYRVPVAP